MRDLIIIGAGPAGLSAAIYGKRAGLDTVVIEESGIGGGQVLTTYEVDNYPGVPGISGFDLGMKLKDHADKAGAEFIDEKVIGVENCEDHRTVITEENRYQTKALIIATGASHNHLNIPGEKELAGMGVSYCATCDGAFFRNRIAVVAGGGDVAVEDAIFLARACSKVYVIHRRDTFRAAKGLQDALFALQNIEVIWNSVIEEIRGDGQVESIILKNVKDQEKRELETDGVFIAVGIHPNTELFRDVVEMDEKGYILAGEDGVTTAPGIFAAGDVRKKKLRQIITAAADGANAVNSVTDYFNHFA